MIYCLTKVAFAVESVSTELTILFTPPFCPPSATKLGESMESRENEYRPDPEALAVQSTEEHRENFSRARNSSNLAALRV